jgi:hypothetical protein
MTPAQRTRGIALQLPVTFARVQRVQMRRHPRKQRNLDDRTVDPMRQARRTTVASTVPTPGRRRANVTLPLPVLFDTGKHNRGEGFNDRREIWIDFGISLRARLLLHCRQGCARACKQLKRTIFVSSSSLFLSPLPLDRSRARDLWGPFARVQLVDGGGGVRVGVDARARARLSAYTPESGPKYSS